MSQLVHKCSYFQEYGETGLNEVHSVENLEHVMKTMPTVLDFVDSPDGVFLTHVKVIG